MSPSSCVIDRQHLLHMDRQAALNIKYGAGRMKDTLVQQDLADIYKSDPPGSTS